MTPGAAPGAATRTLSETTWSDSRLFAAVAPVPPRLGHHIRSPTTANSAGTTRVRTTRVFALAAYVSIDAILSLISQEGPEHSPLGIGITALSLLVMPLLASFEIRTGRELGSKSVLADARQLMLCVYLSGAVFIGLILNSLFGWWWADSVAALIVAALAIREGIEAWRGDVESPFEVLTEMKDE